MKTRTLRSISVVVALIVMALFAFSSLAFASSEGTGTGTPEAPVADKPAADKPAADKPADDNTPSTTIPDIKPKEPAHKVQNLPVEKRWKDVPKGTKLPDSVQVQLYADNKPLKDQVVTLTAENNWKGEFKNVTVWDDTAHDYVFFTIKELNAPQGFETMYAATVNKEGQQTEFAVINTKKTDKPEPTPTDGHTHDATDEPTDEPTTDTQESEAPRVSRLPKTSDKTGLAIYGGLGVGALLLISLGARYTKYSSAL